MPRSSVAVRTPNGPVPVGDFDEAAKAVDYVVQHFTAQEQAARREYLARKRLRESLVGKVARLDPAEREDRDALLNQVLKDCEELSRQHMSEAWSTEKQYSMAFDILREGLGRPGETVGDRNHRFALAREPNPLKVQVQWTRQRPSSATVGRSKWGSPAASPAAQRPRSASFVRRGSSNDSTTGNSDAPSTDHETETSRTSTRSAARASNAEDKPWRACMSLKKIKRLERKHRKNDSGAARLARATKKAKAGGSTGRRKSISKGRIRSPKKTVPKLENFPTYGPQNVAARALRKHKGRTLNAETSHQFVVTRAKEHMKQAAARRAAQLQDEETKAQQIKERLLQLDARAKKTVAQFAQAPAIVSSADASTVGSSSTGGCSTPTTPTQRQKDSLPPSPLPFRSIGARS